MNKKILKSLFAICLLLGYTACTDKIVYEPAEVPTNAQVYFSYTAPTTVALSPDMSVTSFDVNLYRIDKGSSLTVNLIVENGDPEIFSVPTSVSFSAGSEIAKIKIDYDPVKLGFDNFKSFKFTVSDESLASPYGVTSYSFSAGMASIWKSLGMATFSETYVHVGWPWIVEMQQNELFPNRYRLVNALARADYRYTNMPINNNLPAFFEFRILPAGSTYTTFHRDNGTVTINTTVDGLVFYEPISMGVTYNPDTDNSHVYIWHPVARPLAGADTQAESFWMKNTVTRWSKDGTTPEVVQIAPWYVMPSMGGAGWNYTQSDGMITIIFPGVVFSDYSMSLSYLGHYIDRDDVDNAIVQFKVGEDVASYKYAVVEGSLTPGSAGEVADLITAGKIASVEDTEDGYKLFPFEEEGKYSVVAVAYDEGGEAQEFGFVSFEFTPAGMESPWVSLGFCEYSDDIVAPLYGAPVPTYDVEILEHKSKPGLFRLKNAYGEDYPYNDPGDYEEGNVFIEIDATDPDGVFIDLQSMGLDWGDGTMYIFSLAADMMYDGYSYEEIQEEGVFGSYKNKIITFPTKTLLMGDNDGFYYANTGGKWKVDMTSLSPAASKANNASMRSGVTLSKNVVKAPFKIKANMPVLVKAKNLSESAIKIKPDVMP